MSELDRAVPSRVVRLGLPLVAGVGLGVASFCADQVEGAPRLALQFLASTGFSWGCVAFVAAFPARTRAAAAASAVAVLCLATACYYALNVAAARSVDGLAPVLVALGYWLLLSVAGGAALGVLAHLVRTGRAPLAAAAAGLACGLLAGAGIDIVVHLLAAGDHGRVRLAEGLAQAVAGVAVATWAFARRPGHRPWPRFAVAALVACTAGALAWNVVESVPVIGYL